MKNHFFYTVFFSLLFAVFIFGCSNKPVTWPLNGTNLQAEKYRLEISDSLYILIETGNTFSLLSPPDSLLINKFEIEYSAVNPEANQYFRIRANQQVNNSSNPNITEYYKFNDGNVLFIGYETGDTIKPFTLFEPPLIISPSEIKKDFKSSGLMNTFNNAENTFDEGFITNLKIKEISQIDIRDSLNSVKACSLREMILSRDASIAYGEKNLTIPEAILLKTKLLVDPNGIPIAEWTIKTETINISGEQDYLSNKELFIEFTRYNLITNK